MIENSTIFFFYDDLNEENELFTWQDITEGPKPGDEWFELLSTLEYAPSEIVLQRIYQSAKS